MSRKAEEHSRRRKRAREARREARKEARKEAGRAGLSRGHSRARPGQEPPADATVSRPCLGSTVPPAEPSQSARQVPGSRTIRHISVGPALTGSWSCSLGSITASKFRDRCPCPSACSPHHDLVLVMCFVSSSLRPYHSHQTS